MYLWTASRRDETVREGSGAPSVDGIRVPRNAPNGLLEGIEALRDRFEELGGEAKRLTATRVANLAMCNDCLESRPGSSGG